MKKKKKKKNLFIFIYKIILIINYELLYIKLCIHLIDREIKCIVYN